VPPSFGSLLGAANAEADDAMLRKAFLQTPEYHALLHSTDFNYVVGRRGTGKSALFLSLRGKMAEDSGVILLTEQPNDYEMVELQSLLRKVSGEYRVLRPITRLLWGIHLLIETARAASKNYRFAKAFRFVFLTEFLQKHSISQTETGAAQCVRRLKAIIASGTTPEEIPARLATEFQFGVLKDAVREVLDETGLSVVALYDRLDEAWLPDIPAIAILGGLARTAAEARE
jgi:energy-coupling factor transporter ATP-binding protein EcfA2